MLEHVSATHYKGLALFISLPEQNQLNPVYK